MGGLMAGNGTLAAWSPFLGRYPYLAPNLVTVALAVVLVPCVLWGVPETAALKPKPRDAGSTKVGASSPSAPPARPKSILKNDRAAAAITVYTLYSAVEIGLTEVVCLWAVASRDSGGLGASMRDVGATLGAVGVLMCLVQFGAYERHVRDVGERNGVLSALKRNGPCIALLPLLAGFASSELGPRAALVAVFLVHGQGHTRVLQLYFNWSFWRSNVSEKAYTLRELEER